MSSTITNIGIFFGGQRYKDSKNISAFFFTFIILTQENAFSDNLLFIYSKNIWPKLFMLKDMGGRGWGG